MALLQSNSWEQFLPVHSQVVRTLLQSQCEWDDMPKSAE